MTDINISNTYKKTLISLALAFLFVSLSGFGYAFDVGENSYQYKRKTQNTPDNQLIFPFVNENPDGDGSNSTYYGQNGSIHYNNDGDFAFANDTSQRFGASTIIDGFKNQQITGSAPSGLVAYYPLDNDNAWDISGNGNDGTLNGGVTTGATGQVDGAYDFDGSDDYVDAGKDVPSETFSVSAWINYNRTNSGDVDNSIGIAQDTINLRFQNRGAGEHYFRLYDGSFNDVTVPINSEWNHLVMTYNGSQMCGYKNGELVSCVSSGLDSGWTEGIKLGTEPFLTNYFDGKIDDVRIYNRSLSQEEIEARYNATKPISGNDPTFGTEEHENADYYLDSLNISGYFRETKGTGEMGGLLKFIVLIIIIMAIASASAGRRR